MLWDGAVGETLEAPSSITDARELRRANIDGVGTEGSDEANRRIALDPDSDVQERLRAIDALVRGVAPEVAPGADLGHNVLFPILFDESNETALRIAAVRAGADLRGGTIVNNLCGSFSPEKPEIRNAIVRTLREIGERPLPDHLASGLDQDLATLENDRPLLTFLNLTLRFGAHPRVVEVLHSGTSDPSAEIRASAAFQLARIGYMKPATQALLGDAEPSVRASAAEAIGFYWTGEEAPIDALRSGTSDRDPAVAKQAKSAMRRLRLANLAAPSAAAMRKERTPEVDARFPWSEFLHSWSLELCGDEAVVLTQDDAISESGWTGSSPATDDELRHLEHRIGESLPASYRSFLKTTNGYVGGGSVSRIRPAGEVTRFADEEPDWVSIWLDTAGEDPSITLQEHVAVRGRDVVSARWDLLSSAIQVSDVWDGAVYLLCPDVIDDRGEWEARLFATWLPGAARFSSWWDLLTHERGA